MLIVNEKRQIHLKRRSFYVQGIVKPEHHRLDIRKDDLVCFNAINFIKSPNMDLPTGVIFSKKGTPFICILSLIYVSLRYTLDRSCCPL